MASNSVHGAAELIDALNRGADQTDTLMSLVVEKTAVDLTGLVQMRASGRPGPNAPTGDYRGSWRPQREDSAPGSVSWSTGTDRAQARRLEYGFVGIDSLGRQYNQPPYPHMAPAVDEIEPRFEDALRQVAKQALPW